MSSRKPLTAADYKALPEGPPWCQLIEGLLVSDPSPTTRHQDIAGNLHTSLNVHVRGRRLGRVFIAPLDVYLSSENVLQPDVFFVSADHTDRIRSDGIYGAPDLAVEILSPSSAARDRGDKRRIYRAAGTQEYWIIHPQTRSFEIFEFAAQAEGPARVVGPDDILTTPLLPGWELHPASLFLA